MSIELTMPELTEMTPKITVVGVGGAGGNAINNMIEADLQGVDFVAANTDAQALSLSKASNTIQLGSQITQGLGAGAKPEVGKAAAEESLETLEDMLDGAHMVFITAGMGGGTGTGAAPVVAKMAKERGILTVGVVTKPFHFEGSRRMTIAEAGITALQEYVDTLIIIPNQNLFRIANEKTTFADAFSMADQVLHSGVRGITDLMVMPGLINLDFADIKTVMNSMGKAMMGTGEAEGDNRAVNAAEAAISNPLLDEVNMQGAKGVIINITGGMDLTLFEVDEAANYIRSQVDPDANIIVGSAFNPELDGKMRVSVVATGLEEGAGHQDMRSQPMPQRTMTAAPSAKVEAPQPVEAKPEVKTEETPAPKETTDERFDISPDQIDVPQQEEAPKAEENSSEEASSKEDVATPEVKDDQSRSAAPEAQEAPQSQMELEQQEKARQTGDVLNKVAELVQSDTPLNTDDHDDEPEQQASEPQETKEDEDALEKTVQSDGFVAAEPVQPKKVAEPKGQPDAKAAEAFMAGPAGVTSDEKAEEGATSEAAPQAAKPAGNLSLFERLTQNFRNSDQGEEAPRAEPKIDSASSKPSEKKSNDDDDDDDLNIPSFLKNN